MWCREGSNPCGEAHARFHLGPDPQSELPPCLEANLSPLRNPIFSFLAVSDLRVAGEKLQAGTPVNMRLAGVSEEQLWQVSESNTSCGF